MIRPSFIFLLFEPLEVAALDFVLVTNLCDLTLN